MNILIPVMMWFVETRGQILYYAGAIIRKRLSDMTADTAGIEKARKTAVCNHIIKKYFR
jgi:hypothetical protein